MLPISRCGVHGFDMGLQDFHPSRMRPWDVLEEKAYLEQNSELMGILGRFPSVGPPPPLRPAVERWAE